MKVLRSVVGIATLAIVLFSLETSFVSCKKEVVRDTVIVTDTVHIIDSLTCSCYDLTDGLIAYYNFNGGNLNDSSGNNNNIIFSNATKTADRFGTPNNAYLFNGTSNYMQVANSASLNPNNITLMAIVKLNGFYAGECHGNQILQKGYQDQRTGVYSLRVSDNKCGVPVDTTKEKALGIYGDYGYSSNAVDTSNTRTGQWYTLIYTYDGSDAKLYVNGVLKNDTKQTATFTANTSDLFIGRAESSQYPYWWNGVIDEIRIYKKALCEGAVKQLNSTSMAKK